jgi:hypothetical protein
MYGTGTRSYLRSSEHRQAQKEAAAATKKWEAGTRKPVLWPMACTCRQFAYPHLHLNIPYFQLRKES